MASRSKGKSSSADSDPSSKGDSLWFAASPSKRWAELFFLAYSPVWITWALGIIVPLQLYKVRCSNGYKRFVDERCACLYVSRLHPYFRVPANRLHLAFFSLHCALCSGSSRLIGSLCLPSQRFDEWGYMMVGLAAALPCVLVPPFLLSPVSDRIQVAHRE